MKIYNTLTKKIEIIKPIAAPDVTVYTCGPTVYDYPHVGNWFTFVRYDILIRSLKLAGYRPDWVLNITDVGHLVSDADEGEDKLEKGAKREGKTAWDIADYYADYFIRGLKRLNISNPTHLPKATDHIEEQIALVKTLENKGFTYVIDDGVYFDTSKFPEYPRFAELDTDEQQEGARVSPNPQKRNPSDFALWKLSPADSKRDMEWDSPWGRGFPGWHLECSAMAMKYLGETIDIHSGGIDHIPVHHTNEIAQSQGATGKKFSNYWMHTNHVTVDGSKIAKSHGNGITLEDIEKKKFNETDFRFLILQSHYRNQSQFSWDILDNAARGLKHIRGGFSWIYSLRQASGSDSPKLKQYLANYQSKITDSLLNDMDTPEALSLLHACATKLTSMELGKSDIPTLEEFDRFIADALGIEILIKMVLSNAQGTLIKEREQARDNKDWERSDSLRERLSKEGVGLRDTAQGTIWFPL